MEAVLRWHVVSDRDVPEYKLARRRARKAPGQEQDPTTAVKRSTGAVGIAVIGMKDTCRNCPTKRPMTPVKPLNVEAAIAASKDDGMGLESDVGALRNIGA
jgi:hypothetical protein